MTTTVKYDGRCKGYTSFGALHIGDCFRRSHPTDPNRPGVYMKVWNNERPFPTSILLSSGSPYSLGENHPVVPLNVVINASDA